ncbi:MAG: error-prone DNA polymerase [Polyangiaceae bacterium]|nr:error-prone DNA polymerase [Polyangiaceae bacterium]
MFAELLARSNFSFLTGASHPAELVVRAKQLGLAALALTDRMGLYGSVRAHAQAQESEQAVIVGAELVLDPAVPSRSPTSPSEARLAALAQAPSVALLAQDHAGYSNLCRLITLAHAGHPKGEGALRLEDLALYHQGLVAVVPAPRDPSGPDAPPDALLGLLRDVFAERALLAAHRHLDAFDGARLDAVDAWSSRFGLAVVASARPLFHQRSQKPVADVIACIREGTTLDSAATLLAGNTEAFLRSELEMQKLFRERPAWVERTAEVASECRFSLSELRYQFPCTLEPGESADDKLRRLAQQGAARRYPGGVPSSVAQQIEKELALIAQLAVAPYFLSTWEIVEIARSRRILCQGRGSAANSAVCYVLGITAVDPARSNLLFERFMSAERSEPPDIDIDFEHERREEVIQEIYARHGRDRAAMVSEVICYRGKSALREVGKVFGLSLEQVDRLSGAITHWDSAEVSDARLAELGFDPADPRLCQSVTLARAIEGFPRHLSIHVGGFVLSAAPLYEVAPIEPARMPERTVMPWDKDDIEALGFFKIDVLGLGMLTAIRKCLELIWKGGGLGRLGGSSASTSRAEREPIPGHDPIELLTRIPAEDPSVYDLCCRADTVGVFQIESRAQMAMLPRLKPRRFYDLVVEVALVRPGPIQGGMVHPYLRRRNREEPVDSPHPALWPILERTLGVPLFQEQVMQIAIVGAGYSGGEADQLRRDMAAWKKHGKLLRHKSRLLEGFAARGISAEFGARLFEQIKGFGEYGFPESHAASFALLVYASAWQKAHYPAHFACALVNSLPMGFYSASTIFQDAQRHGVELREVSIVASFWDCELEPAGEANGIRSQAPDAARAVRLGFRLVKGLAEASARRIEVVRAKAAFCGIDDLIRRAALRKDEVERLAEAGALEPLVPGRRNAVWQSRAPRVGGLFERLALGEPQVVLPPLRAAEQLLLDYERKGLSITDHPMRHLRERLRGRGVLTAAELAQQRQGRAVSVAGLVVTRQQPATASGVVFVTLEDETGFVNLILWQRVYERLRLTARHSRLMLASGKVERDRESTRSEVPIVHVIVEHLERLDRPDSRLGRQSRDFH